MRDVSEGMVHAIEGGQDEDSQTSRNHVAEVGAGRDRYVLHRVGEGPASVVNTFGKDGEIVPHQDGVGSFAGDMGAPSTEIPTSAS